MNKGGNESRMRRRVITLDGNIGEARGDDGIEGD
jgi:hypothetical protein